MGSYSFLIRSTAFLSFQRDSRFPDFTQTSERTNIIPDVGPGKIIRCVGRGYAPRVGEVCLLVGEGICFWRFFLLDSFLRFALPCILPNPVPDHYSAGTALHNLHSAVSVINSVECSLFYLRVSRVSLYNV